jgi:uncharacterized protein (TIGR00661 family)
MKNRPRILVAPLDWGLGHATRCIPIINELTDKNVDVVIGADNRPYELLRKEFPYLEHIKIPGYAVRYVEQGNLGVAIIKQLPAILRGFRNENILLRQIIEEYKIDAVISDSRYGLTSSTVPTVFLIHQITILLPPFLQWAQSLVAFANRQFIRRFSECWIPDLEGENNISGALSHNVPLPKNTFYIGALSRIKIISETKKEYDILVIISGPEPQRTIFEDMIVDQLKKTSYRAFIVRGIPEKNLRIKLSDTIVAASSVTTEEISRLIASSVTIISRPGYSTVMDLSFTGSNAIFIPTPQQTEQVYLAAMLKEAGICYSEPQNNFSLERSLDQSKAYSGFSAIPHNPMLLLGRIGALLEAIEKRAR